MNRYMMTECVRVSIYTAAYLAGWFLGGTGFSVPSCLCLLGVAVFLYVQEYKHTRELLNLRGLLALGLLGGEGIARLQLSHLSTVWTTETWLSFYLFYLVFDLVSAAVMHFPEHIAKEMKRRAASDGGAAADAAVCPADAAMDRKTEGPSAAQRLLFFQRAIVLLLLMSWGAFLIEALRLGFVPLFTVDTPHAYSTFHLKGVHYITTLAVLIPALSMLYLSERRRVRQKPDILGVLGLLLPLLLTMLLVSRFQMMFAVFLAVFTALLSGQRFRFWQLLLLLGFLIAAYIFITIERAHSVEYLNSIFEMKDAATPIFVTQPYMYVANNYDNFNVMTEQLMVHAWGLRMLYPFVTLTGLKFFFPALNQAFPLFTNKEELTTVTMLYDAWYDFGIPGILLLAVLIGTAAGAVSRAHRRKTKPLARLLYAQLAFYFLFSFFTTWFSNPATWFYLLVSFALYTAYDGRHPACRRRRG